MLLQCEPSKESDSKSTTFRLRRAAAGVVVASVTAKHLFATAEMSALPV